VIFISCSSSLLYFCNLYLSLFKPQAHLLESKKNWEANCDGEKEKAGPSELTLTILPWWSHWGTAGPSPIKKHGIDVMISRSQLLLIVPFSNPIKPLARPTLVYEGSRPALSCCRWRNLSCQPRQLFVSSTTWHGQSRPPSLSTRPHSQASPLSPSHVVSKIWFDILLFYYISSEGRFIWAIM